MKASEQYRLLHIDETDSTNNAIRNYANAFPQDHIVVLATQFQTSGRGQRGNSWEAEKGKNLLFSILCRPTFLEIRQQFALSQAISLSIKEELELYTRPISIKWPNDIYWNEKKIGGILIENDLEGKHIALSILGVGLNINQAHFTSNAPNPVSLMQATGRTNETETLLQHLLERFVHYYRKLEEGESESVAKQYRESLLRKEGYHKYSDENGTFEARIHHIEQDGHMVLQDTDNRLRTYAFKEVHFVFGNSNAEDNVPPTANPSPTHP